MAPRANWKGFLRLSLVNCPVALYPATSESKKSSFNQLNRKTGHRIKCAKVDADEKVANEDIVKGDKVDTDTSIEVTKEELEERRAGITVVFHSKSISRRKAVGVTPVNFRNVRFNGDASLNPTTSATSAIDRSRFANNTFAAPKSYNLRQIAFLAPK